MPLSFGRKISKILKVHRKFLIIEQICAHLQLKENRQKHLRQNRKNKRFIYLISPNKLNKNFLLLCGFENFGNYYIRVDILEKLFLKIIDGTKNGKFKISSEMMNLLGCSKENFYKVMELMDYKREKKDEDIFCYKGSRKINKIKFFKRKNNPFQKLSSLNLK